MKMRGIQSIMVAAMLLLATAMPSLAQEGTANVEARIAVEVAGTTPDNPFYWLDVALDRISLLIASLEGPQAHARMGLEIADERLAEAEVMAEQGNFEAMASAEHEHRQMLAAVKERIRNIEHVNATSEIEIQIELERDVVEHRKNVERFGNELEVSIEIEGNVTPEQIALISSILNRLQAQTGEVEIEIEIAKGETRIEIMQQTGKDEVEIEIEIERIERQKGLVRMEERALEQIEDAVEEIAEVQAIVEVANITEPAVLTLVERAQARLEQAQTAFEQGNYGEAFGQAVAAERLAENAEEFIEQMEEEIEEIREELEELREEIEERRAEIEERMREEAREGLEEQEQANETLTD